MRLMRLPAASPNHNVPPRSAIESGRLSGVIPAWISRISPFRGQGRARFRLMHTGSYNGKPAEFWAEVSAMSDARLADPMEAAVVPFAIGRRSCAA